MKLAALLIGTGRLFEKTGGHPADAVETFTACRGVTAAGLQATLDRGFQDVVSAGLDAAPSKAIELGRPPG